MSSAFPGTARPRVRFQRRSIVTAISSLLLCGGLVSQQAQSMELSSSEDLKVRWDNTLKYTTAWRVASPDLEVANQKGNWQNNDFGNLGFERGDQINSRVDLLSEFDLTYKNVGFRVSGAAWYDDVYAKGTNSFSGAFPNTQAALFGGPNNKLPESSKHFMANYSEIADAFVFGKFDLGGDMLTVRAGKHTVIYGESLFLGANAIAAAQGPVDVNKAWSSPTALFKEVALPVKQISASLALDNDVSLGAYYQFEWKPLRLPGVGSYFSFSDAFGPGGDIALLAGGALPVLRGNDYKGRDSGQWGMQLKFKVGDVDYGLYAARFDDKAPILSVNLSSVLGFAGPGTPLPTYNMMYAKNIDVYGASFSTVVSGTNIAGEISTRRNTPLQAPGDAVLFVTGMNNEDNTPYARGNSLHVNLSSLSIFPGTKAWGAASLVVEYAYNRLLNVKWNPSTAAFPPLGYASPLNVTHTKEAHAIRAVFQPEYFQVMPGVDLQVPIGIGYGLSGRSAIVTVAPEHGGDFSLGVNATVDRTWKLGAAFVHYFGNVGSAHASQIGPNPTAASYKNFNGDRDFISLSVQRTF